jgi:hypothetical protein
MGCELDSWGSGQRPLTSFCEHDTEPSNFTKMGNILSRWVIISFSRTVPCSHLKKILYRPTVWIKYICAVAASITNWLTRNWETSTLPSTYKHYAVYFNALSNHLHRSQKNYEYYKFINLCSTTCFDSYRVIIRCCDLHIFIEHATKHTT